jgi:hypothetical protein
MASAEEIFLTGECVEWRLAAVLAADLAGHRPAVVLP